MAAQDALMQGIIDAINNQTAELLRFIVHDYVNSALVTFKASSATVVKLKDPTPLRRGLIIVNTDANNLYLRYGDAASTSSGGWTYIIPAGATWEMPKPIYTGLITGIWTAAGSGIANMTEV